MEQVSIEDLIDTRILPFDLYSEDDEKLMEAGDILTPGKLLQLRHAGNVYKKEHQTSGLTAEQIESIKNSVKISSDDENTENRNEDDVINEINIGDNIDVDEDTIENLIRQNQQNAEAENDGDDSSIDEVNESYDIIENFDLNLTPRITQNSPIDSIDISRYKGPTNKTSVIEETAQLKIKAYYSMILNQIAQDAPANEIINMYSVLKDKIATEVNNNFANIKYYSEIKFIGEYERCHAINTAFLSGLLTKKILPQEEALSDVIMAALLHDIGKSRLPKDIFLKETPTKQEQALMRSHALIGYEVIKNEYRLPEHIARVALQHHENYDGTGYPNGISGDLIAVESRIVAACNYFDNLTFNKTPHKIRNSREALKVMLATGSRDFSPDVFFTFIYLFNYSDRTNFEDMVR